MDLLLAISGPEAGVLYSEIEKISLLGRKRVGVDEIAEMLHGSGRESVFSLAEAIVAGNRALVFRIYRSIRDTLEPYSVLGAINWKFSQLSKKDSGGRREYFSMVFRCLSEADAKVKSSGGWYPLEDLFVKLLQI
jgi:DNA polymerase III delta subunit